MLGAVRLQPGHVNAVRHVQPLQDLAGTITPADLHFTRIHAGVPTIDPATHTLLVHGLVLWGWHIPALFTALYGPLPFAAEGRRMYPDCITVPADGTIVRWTNSHELRY